jgi:hypothetical protein
MPRPLYPREMRSLWLGESQSRSGGGGGWRRYKSLAPAGNRNRFLSAYINSDSCPTNPLTTGQRHCCCSHDPMFKFNSVTVHIFEGLATYLRCFAKLGKATISFVVCLSVRPAVRPSVRTEGLGSH